MATNVVVKQIKELSNLIAGGDKKLDRGLKGVYEELLCSKHNTEEEIAKQLKCCRERATKGIAAWRKAEDDAVEYEVDGEDGKEVCEGCIELDTRLSEQERRSAQLEGKLEAANARADKMESKARKAVQRGDALAEELRALKIKDNDSGGKLYKWDADTAAEDHRPQSGSGMWHEWEPLAPRGEAVRSAAASTSRPRGAGSTTPASRPAASGLYTPPSSSRAGVRAIRRVPSTPATDTDTYTMPEPAIGRTRQAARRQQQQTSTAEGFCVFAWE